MHQQQLAQWLLSIKAQSMRHEAAPGMLNTSVPQDSSSRQQRQYFCPTNSSSRCSPQALLEVERLPTVVMDVGQTSATGVTGDAVALKSPPWQKLPLGLQGGKTVQHVTVNQNGELQVGN
jgi:hypothetical protein